MTAPLKILVVKLPLAVMVATPVLVEATEIGLANVPPKSLLNVALALPLESPMVIVPVPKALALVVPETMPDLMITPPSKELFPESTNVPAPSLVIDPVLLMIPVPMVKVPVPLPLLFTVKVLVPERVAAPESVSP